MRRILVELGNGNEKYTPEQLDRLEQSIRSLFHGHFPCYLSYENIRDKFYCKYYSSRDTHDQKINHRIKGLETPINQLKHRCVLNGFTKIEERNIFILPDFSNREHLNGVSTEKRKELLKKFGDGKYNFPTSIEFKKKGDDTLFLYPRLYDADYALIFQYACSVVDTSADERIMYTIRYNNKKDLISIDLDGLDEKQIKQLHYCAYYITDLIIGYLATEHASMRDSEDKGYNSGLYATRFKTAISKLQDNIYYSPTKTVKDAATALLTTPSVRLDKEGRRLLSLLVGISDSCSKKRLCIPEYSIYIPTLLEHYSYAVLKQSDFFSNLKYKAKTFGGTPDMSLELDDVTIYIDTKNKYDYIEPFRIDLEGDESVKSDKDVQMVRFHFSGEKTNIILFIYPDMSREDIVQEVQKGIKMCLDNDLWVAKVGFCLPLKEVGITGNENQIETNGADGTSNITAEAFDLKVKELVEQILVLVQPLLTPREWTILNDYLIHEKSLKTIGKDMGLSGERIRQLIIKATRKIKIKKKQKPINAFNVKEIIDTYDSCPSLQSQRTNPSSARRAHAIAIIKRFQAIYEHLSQLSDEERQALSLLTTSEPLEGEYNHNVYLALRQYYRKRQKHENEPLLGNQLMKRIAQILPTTMSDLRQIPGMGRKKIKTYGRDVIEIVQQYNISQEPHTTDSL